MEVVLRPVNDAFLKEVVFPALEQGVVDAAPAIEHLIAQLGEDQTRVELELLLDRGIEGTFFGLEDERWSTSIYRLLFHEWKKSSRGGWGMVNESLAYAGDWDSTLHLSLMLEDPAYPYWDEVKASQFRTNFTASPFSEQGLASLTCGIWEPVPGFPPDQVLTVAGHGDYRPQDGVARADWSWRPLHVVNQWAAQLPNALSRLLEKESRRLRPVQAPEKHEVLQYWLGRTAQPPVLAVTFSGLGERSNEWIREIGYLAKMIRAAAAAQLGLTAVISHRGVDDYLER
ncbi:MAG: hypothetical protein IPJ65_05250 [Archangiaceae bacterium]|nr:hypothetical protein [Archangiaceae bacterium]